ncbi:MAG: ABC transporter substrate-binding protein [Bacteroidetes bacterium]|nr:ABC transporter substrate-binding protein [Bacteroidota bacterium]MCL5025053.1 ABC transporter substrate-binding protein [Chloroflexota bacterium]
MRTRFVIAATVGVLLVLLGACAPVKPTASPAPPAPTAATAAPAVASKPAAATTATPRPGESPVATAAKVKRGGILVHARNKNVESFDNVLQLAFDAPAATLIYEHLLTYDLVDPATGKHELKPELAESWEFQEPTKVLMKLRKGIKFSDGSEFNAEVAKWNIDRLKNEPKSVGKDKVADIKSVDVVDPYTIQINLVRPTSTALLKLSNGISATAAYANTMASKAAFDKGGADYLHSNPIGTGPMVLTQWLPEDKFTFKRRDDYWQKGVDGKPLPYLDGFTERYIPDSAVSFVELRAGTVQMANNVDLKDVAAVKADPNLVYDEQPWVGQERFVYGLNDSKGVFKDNLKLRQAVHYAIDRASMAKTIGFGLAKPTEYFLWVPGMLGYDPSVIKYSYDQNKAKQLLTEAGYPNGIDITLTTIARDPDRKISEMAKFMWDAVGIRTKIDTMERAAALAVWKSGDFDIGFQSIIQMPDPDVLAAKNLSCTGPNNLTKTCDKEFDACMAEGGAVVNNDQKRDEIYKRCVKLLQEHAFKQSAYLEPMYFVHTKAVKGITIHWQDPDLRWAWLDQ